MSKVYFKNCLKLITQYNKYEALFVKTEWFTYTF